jgi:class 3 adenylate cyclase
MRRVLVAILSIDVVGYSRLMGRDERRTVGRLHENREIIARTVEDHGGRVFGVAGDSEMAAFEDECAMLRAALEIQEKIASLNAELPKTERMLLRIGLGYGRVIKEGPDLYGDGVNIAARVMALAGANEIYAMAVGGCWRVDRD